MQKLTPRKKLWNIIEYVNNVVRERENQINSAVLAILSKKSCFFLGSPGSAKTYSIELLCEFFDMSLFNTLMSETTKPEMIFGPVDVPALAEGSQRVKIKGYAPTAEVLFFDEIFKANDIVLNPLLWLLNEKKFRNGDDGIINCPVISVFAASNETPKQKELAPIYDRFLLRHEVDYVQESANLTKMYKFATGQLKYEKPDRLSKKEMLYIHNKVSEVEVPQEVWDSMMDCRNTVQNNINILISDRRMLQSLEVVKAQAYLSGRKIADISDVAVLANILWDDPKYASNKDGADSEAILQMAQERFELAFQKSELVQCIRFIKEQMKKHRLDSILYRKLIPMLEKLRDAVKNRKTIQIIQMIGQDKRVWFRLSSSVSQYWNAEELRTVGFKKKRNADYFYIPPSKGLNATSVSAKITKVLKVEVKVIEN
jgi:MoxR-like ATPase